MTSLIFYGGVNEIGGNKILLEDKGTKIFLDFGMSFSLNGMYFDKFLKPRVAVGIKDYIEMGLINQVSIQIIMEQVFLIFLIDKDNYLLVPNFKIMP